MSAVGSIPKACFDDAGLLPSIAGQVEDRRLDLAQRAHDIETSDRHIGGFQRLEPSIGLISRLNLP